MLFIIIIVPPPPVKRDSWPLFQGGGQFASPPPPIIYASASPSFCLSLVALWIVNPPVLCPSPGCQIRVRVITSESESKSESSPQSPSPSHKSSSPHIQHLFSSKHKNKQQNVSNVEVNSATRHSRYCLDSGVTRARVTSHDFWVWVRVRVKVKKLDSSPSPSKMDLSPSPYSSHTALESTVCKYIKHIPGIDSYLWLALCRCHRGRSCT